jgi:hypothetical protein
MNSMVATRGAVLEKTEDIFWGLAMKKFGQKNGVCLKIWKRL